MAHLAQFLATYPAAALNVELQRWVVLAMDFEKELLAAEQEESYPEQPRRLSKWMGVGLVALYRFFESNPQEEYCHMENLWATLGLKAQRMRDVSRLKHWGLLERKTPDPDSVVRGYWKLTGSAKEFVSCKIFLSKTAVVRNDTVIRFEGKTVSIKDVLGSPGFNIVDLRQLQDAAFAAYFIDTEEPKGFQEER